MVFLILNNVIFVILEFVLKFGASKNSNQKWIWQFVFDMQANTDVC